MTLKAGKLRHRIDIEELIETRDTESGDVLTHWCPVYRSVPAAIEPLSVKEFIASRSTQSQLTARITIRYRDGLTAKMRIKHNGKIYNPEGWLPDPDSGLEYLTAPVSQGVNQG